MPTRLTWFRLTGAVVIGLAFTALPHSVAYPLTLFVFLIGVGAGFVEEAPLRAGEGERGAERPLQRAAQRALTLSALLALLLAEPESAYVLAPPLLATLLRELVAVSIREAMALRGAPLRIEPLGRWRARIEFLAIAALLAAGAQPGVFSGGPAAFGAGFLWIGATLGLYEVWRELRIALAWFREEEAERAAAEAAAERSDGAWARIPALRKDRREKG